MRPLAATYEISMHDIYLWQAEVLVCLRYNVAVLLEAAAVASE
jgi:hypothetical protein